MRSKAIFVALLAFAFGAQAVPVSREQAATAVRKWIRSGHHLGMRHGTEVEKSATLTTDGGRKFHAIKLKGRGTVFTSSDTESEPIVAFTSSTEDFSSIDRKSPLWALLSRDAEVRANIRAYRAAEEAKARKARVQAQAANPAVTGATATATPTAQVSGEGLSPAARRWARLLSEAAVSDPARTSASAPRKEDESEIDDIRRSPLLTTTWSQTTHNDDMPEGFVCYKRELDEETGEVTYVPVVGTGKPCYNYYTPWSWGMYYIDEEGNWDFLPEQTPCGCTATATSQLMNYFRYPVEPLDSVTFECELDRAKTNLTTIGGIYNWDMMCDHPKDGVTDGQCEAIGHLAYDVGVALKSSYSAGNTSALPYDIPAALKEYFGYRNALCLWAEQLIGEATGEKATGYITSNVGLHNPIIRRNVVYTNLDNKRPVIFGIYGFNAGHVGDSTYWAGHAVVGDGYGFLNFRDEETGEATNTVEYVHINMGWSGSDDAWYNIPEIDAVETGASGADSGFNFTVMAAAVYNVFTSETGEIISGRVFDAEGNPLPGVIVESEDLSAVTDEKGIYSMIVPSASNRVVSAYYDRDNFEGSSRVVVKESSYPLRVGNVWGADIHLGLSPYAYSVRRNGDDGTLYGSVDAAYAEAASGDTIEVLKASRIRSKVFGFDRDVTLTATNDVPDETPVALRIGGEVSVTDGARLNLTNLAFRGGEYHILSNIFTHVIIVYGGEERTVTEIPPDLDIRNFTNITAVAEMDPIMVEAGAKLSVAGLLTVPELEFEDDNGFVLAGEIFDDLTVVVPSFERGARVGSAECDEDAAIASSQYIVNLEDRFMTAMPSPYPTLVWDLAHVEDSDLVATLDIGGDTRTYRYSNLDRLLKDAGEGDVTITVKKDCTLTKPLEVRSRKLAIQGGEFGLTVGNLGPDAGFIIGDGGSLTVSNVTFSGHKGAALFTVNGEGAQLTLADATWLTKLTGTTAQSGAVTVKKGTVTLLPGCAITDCVANGAEMSSGKGGAVYLNGADCTLNLYGGWIMNCTALSANGGGGVYAARNSTVNLMGPVVVKNNTSGSGTKAVADDILMNATKTMRPSLIVQDELTGGTESIGVRYDNNIKDSDYGNTAGRLFADVACGLAEAESSASAFFSDVNPDGIKSTFDNFGEAMVWEEIPPAGPRTEPSDSDVARIVRSATVTNYFDWVGDAFASIDEDGLTVEMLKECVFYEDIVLSHAVTVCRAADAPADVTLPRTDECGFVIPAGASLTVSNLTVLGSKGVLGRKNSKRLFDVCGGELTLGPGAEVRDVDGAGNRAAGAVVVSANGVFTMTNAVIRNCRNSFINAGNATGVGAGLLVDNGKAYLYGGTITDCTAYRSSGVCVGNGGSVYVLGEMNVTGNTDLSGAPSDFTVEDLESLYLSEELTGDASIGIEDGIFVDTNVFGRVDGDYSKPVSNLVASAALFFRDSEPEVKGLIVTNADEALLVWSSAVRADGIYVDKGGKEYVIVAYPPEPQVLIPVAVPTAVDGLVYNALEQTGVVAVAEGYLLTGNTATNAGAYKATAQLAWGYKWSDDDTTVPKEIGWTIAKATHDMSGVSFDDATFTYDGTPKSIFVTGDLPEGVMTNYTGNGQTEIGNYDVTVDFIVDEVNYNPIASMTRTLTIIDDQPVPPPVDPVQTNWPSKIAFQSITRVSDLEWALVVTNRKELCWYRLIYTDDLTKGFTTTGGWEQATETGPWVTNVIFKAEEAKPAYFWRAEGTWGTDEVPPIPPDRR